MPLSWRFGFRSRVRPGGISPTSTARREHPQDVTCLHPNRARSRVILAEPVEHEVRQYLIGKLCDPKELAETEAQRDRLLDLYLEQKVSKAAYERRYEALT